MKGLLRGGEGEAGGPIDRDGAYAPFDQDRHLSEPPWSPSDPALIAWEAGHGHDVRLKCYPEFGCRAIEDDTDRRLAVIAAAAETLPCTCHHDHDGPVGLPCARCQIVTEATA